LRIFCAIAPLLILFPSGLQIIEFLQGLLSYFGIIPKFWLGRFLL